MNREEWFAQLFERLGNSKFRTSFHLKPKDNLIPLCNKCNKAKGSRIMKREDFKYL